MKIIIYSFLACFYLCSSFCSWGQDDREIDSLVQLIPKQTDLDLLSTYNKLFKKFIQKDPRRAKTYLDASKPIVARLNTPDIWKAVLLFNEGRYYQNSSEFVKAEKYYKDAIKIYQENGSEQALASTYNNLGVAQKNLGKTAAALESYLKAIKSREIRNESDRELMIPYLNIGVLYAKLGNLEMSDEYYKKTEALCIKYDVPYGLAIAKSNRATNLVEKKKYQEALDLYYAAIPYFEENNLTFSLAEQCNLIGAAYIKMDSLSQAKMYLGKSIEFSKSNGMKSMLGLATRNLGEVSFKEKNYTKALDLFKSSLELSKQTANNIELSEDYLKISQAYEQLGNLSKAYEYRKMYATVHDSIFDQENKDKFRALEIKYENEKSEQEIALQKKEIALLEEKEKLSSLQRAGLLAGLVIAIVLFGVIYYGIRQKMKRNQLERERVKEELAFKKKELTTHALHLAKKNEVLEKLKQKASTLKQTEGGGKAYQELIRTINFDQQDDKVWENFTLYFEAVHKDFEKVAVTTYPDISKNELRLMALIKMNLSSKEIAHILNISSDGVKKARQRLRKKMGLKSDDSLEITILSI